MKRLLLPAILIIAAASASLGAVSSTNRPAVVAKPARTRPLPFHGNLGTVDLQAKTIKVGKRVFQLTPETKVTKNGKAATLHDALPGDEVGGSYRDTGTALQLVSVRFGPKPAK